MHYNVKVYVQVGTIIIINAVYKYMYCSTKILKHVYVYTHYSVV